MLGANFKNVKLGDLIKFTIGSYSCVRTCIGRVTKITAAQFMVGSYRFRKSDGKQIGEQYRYAKPATEAELEEQKAEQYKKNLQTSLIRWFDDYNNVATLTVTQLEAVQNIIKQTPEQ